MWTKITNSFFFFLFLLSSWAFSSSAVRLTRQQQVQRKQVSKTKQSILLAVHHDPRNIIRWQSLVIDVQSKGIKTVIDFSCIFQFLFLNLTPVLLVKQADRQLVSLSILSPPAFFFCPLRFPFFLSLVCFRSVWWCVISSSSSFSFDILVIAVFFFFLSLSIL